MDSSVATASAERVAEGRERILTELRKVIVGQDEVVEEVLIALFTGGHCLITGVPGLAAMERCLVVTEDLLTDPRVRLTPELRAYWASDPGFDSMRRDGFSEGGAISTRRPPRRPSLRWAALSRSDR